MKSRNGGLMARSITSATTHHSVASSSASSHHPV